MVNAGGSLTGGSLAKSTGVLSRASEIQRLAEQTAKLIEKQRQTETLLEQLNREYSAIEAEVLGSKADLSNRQQELVRMGSRAEGQ